MAVEKPFTPKLYEDFLSSFEAGCNTGVSPLLLQSNQLAFGLNLSIRGGFATHRPPYQKKTLNFGGNVALQLLVQTGLFQGGGYYRPDYGTESLIVQISGHLLLFTESGSTWNVTDISIPGDLNDANVSQVWMWQAEKWMIVQDGTGKLPIFYDGTISRRSYGPSILLGTAIAFAPANPPAIGAIETVTLSAPYTGPLNVPVIFNGEFYQPTSANTLSVVLTNINDTPGTVIPAGTNIIVDPAVVGQTSQTAIFQNGIVSGQISINIPVVPPANAQVGDTLLLNGNKVVTPGQYPFAVPGTTPYTVYETDTVDNPNVVRASAGGDSSKDLGFQIPKGSIIRRQTSQPSFILAQTTAPYTVPAVGASVTVAISVPYTGAQGQDVLIGSSYYSIANVAPVPPGTVLQLINLTDFGTTPYVNPSKIMSVPEIPAGRMGAYGLCVNGISLTDGISYVTSDADGSGAGTPANSYRDAVLKMTQNTFLAGGGAFRLPGTGDLISSVVFPPLLDTSLGQGPMMIGTPFSFFSNAVIGTNPAGWDAITSPIQSESLKDNGALGQNSTVLVDSDTYFRSNIGIGTLIIARRDFGTNSPGNKTISNEVGRILDPDNQALLPYGSGYSFDNRMQMTVAPLTTSSGVAHQGTVSLNRDLLSSMRGSVPAAWEGLWTGLNILQLITGRVNGVRRAFAFSFNYTANQIELYESLKEKTTSFADNDVTPILWAFETPVMFGKSVKRDTELCQLRDGEVYLSDIQGNVHVEVYYRPDFYPCWTLWNAFDVCQSTDANNSKNGYRMRIGLGEPSVLPSEIANNRPLRNGYFFQCRVVITGSCVFKGMRASALQQPQPVYAPIECTPGPCQLIDCDIPDDFTLYGLQGFPPSVPLPNPPVPQPFSNATIFLTNYCPISLCSLGAGPVATGALPGYIQVDTANNQVIGAAGLFRGVTQAAADAAALAFYKGVAPTLNIACPGIASSLLSGLTWVATNTCSIAFAGTAASPTIKMFWGGNFACPCMNGINETAFFSANFCNNTNAPITIQAAIAVLQVTGAATWHQGLKLNGNVLYFNHDVAGGVPPGYPAGNKLDGITTIVCPPGQVTQLLFQADNLQGSFFGQNSGTLTPATINLTIV